MSQRWTEGKIITLLKAGKNVCELGSYRPVCLTSCMGKWFERVIANRLRWVLEKCGLSVSLKRVSVSNGCWVNVDGARGHRRNFQQGLQQRSVISPL